MQSTTPRKEDSYRGGESTGLERPKRSESAVQRDMQTQWTAKHGATSCEAFPRPAVPRAPLPSRRPFLPGRPALLLPQGVHGRGCSEPGSTVRGAQRPESSPLLRLSKDPRPNCPIATRSLKMNIHKIKQQQQNTTSFSTISTFKNFIILEEIEKYKTFAFFHN